MALKTIITHQIQHPSPTQSVTTHCRPEPNKIEGYLEELVYELKSQFVRKGGKNYGRFSAETAEHPFSAWLAEYRAERLGFTSFTQKAMGQCASELEKTQSPLDAHLMFVEEHIEAGQFLYVFLLEHMSGLYLDADMEPDTSRYLDTAGFRFAAKIDLQAWEAGDSATYLTMMRLRGDKELADVFSHLLGFSDKHDIKTDTSEFLALVDNYSESLDESSARLARTQVVDYCLEQDKAGRPVVITELSDTLSQALKTPEPAHFSRFVEERQSEKKPEFIPDAGQIRSYVRISGRTDSLSMSFASECLGKEVVYDPDQDVLTITKLPPALKSRLLKHLKQR
ncbi:nucleoid-associated protein [Marinimicrobium alkaliphilum]|uniref:nucleoid-associated protein n=1 Tax=Marinimicrobium alkaliphilum TaxID=2202654 RepID=UPI000DB92976|nr:nucleoid-associated protein [Marinimicrobium alkaliphilum]